MAFKILSQTELASLNEREKDAYEQAYKEYLERIAFVERLEQLENVRMPKISVKKKGIKKINNPTVPVIKANGFTVNTTAGVDLLNVTKKLNSVLGEHSDLPSVKPYKAALPDVVLSNPDDVDVKIDKPFVVEGVPVVPIVNFSQTQYESPKNDVVLPAIKQINNPELSGVVIEDYSVSTLPTVNTDMPNVPESDIKADVNISLSPVKVATPTVEQIEIKQSDPIMLKSISVPTPETVDVSINDFKVTPVDINIVNAPNIDFNNQPGMQVSLLPVPIPENNDISVHINNSLIDVLPEVPVGVPEINAKVTPSKVTKLEAVPMPEFAPNVTVKNSQAELTKLEAVHMPEFAPDIYIERSAVTEIAPPAVSVPKDIYYIEPKCKIDFVKIPVITALPVDTDTELKKILSTIR